jgi:hypothetical protein
MHNADIRGGWFILELTQCRLKIKIGLEWGVYPDIQIGWPGLTPKKTYP